MNLGKPGYLFNPSGNVLPLPEERRRIVAVAQSRLHTARLLLSRDELPRVDVGTAGWPPAKPGRVGPAKSTAVRSDI